jgi:hypothetical protein
VEKTHDQSLLSRLSPRQMPPTLTRMLAWIENLRQFLGDVVVADFFSATVMVSEKKMRRH